MTDLAWQDRAARHRNDGPCIHPDCDRDAIARGMCNVHYRRSKAAS